MATAGPEHEAAARGKMRLHMEWSSSRLLVVMPHSPPIRPRDVSSVIAPETISDLSRPGSTDCAAMKSQAARCLGSTGAVVAIRSREACPQADRSNRGRAMKLAPIPQANGRGIHVRRLAIAALALAAPRRLRGQEHLRSPAAAQSGRRRRRCNSPSPAISRPPATPRRSSTSIWWRACRASSHRSTTRTAPASRRARRCSRSSPSPTSSSSTGAGGARPARRRTLKQAEADFKRQAELRAAPGGLAGRPRHARPRRATTRRPICSRRRPTPGSPRSTTATPRSPRRSTASSRAHMVSVGELVGGTVADASSPPSSQLDPIYVNFNVNEQDVLRVRAEARAPRHDRRRL